MLSVKAILCLNACLGIYLYLLLLPRGAYVEVLNEHHFFRRGERDNSSNGFVSTRVIHLSTEYVQKCFATKSIS